MSSPSSSSSSSFAPKLSATQKYGNRQSGKYIFVYSIHEAQVTFLFPAKKAKMHFVELRIQKGPLSSPMAMGAFFLLSSLRSETGGKSQKR